MQIVPWPVARQVWGLVLDRPLERDESAGSPELTGAAVALGLTRVLPITEQLEENLGLDEVSFQGMGGDDTAVVAGKRLHRGGRFQPFWKL